MAFILIIDDDENLYQRAAEALVAAGHACGCAKSPDQARDLLRLRNPDLILIDRESTGVSLDPLLGELDLHPRNIPVVTLSRVSGAGDGVGKVVHGTQDCIRKPFDPRFLVWRVEHALEVHAAKSRKPEIQGPQRMAVGQPGLYRRTAMQGW